MPNRFFVCLFALLLLHLSPHFVVCVHGQTLIFGPEFYSPDQGKPLRVIKNFSVQNPNVEFILSVQNGEREEGKVSRAAIEINGVRVVGPDEFDKQLMITKSIRLHNRNEIVVEVISGSGSSIVVTIMDAGESSVQSTIPPEGGTINLEGYASVTFPARAFTAAQNVTLSSTASPVTQGEFEATALGPHLPYEIRINSGYAAPKTDFEVYINVPDSFIASDYEMHIFAQIHEAPEASETHDRFHLFNSGYDIVTKAVHTTMPKYVFSNRYGTKGTYEAIVTVGVIP